MNPPTTYHLPPTSSIHEYQVQHFLKARLIQREDSVERSLTPVPLVPQLKRRFLHHENQPVMFFVQIVNILPMALACINVTVFACMMGS